MNNFFDESCLAWFKYIRTVRDTFICEKNVLRKDISLCRSHLNADPHFSGSTLSCFWLVLKHLQSKTRLCIKKKLELPFTNDQNNAWLFSICMIIWQITLVKLCVVVCEWVIQSEQCGGIWGGWKVGVWWCKKRGNEEGREEERRVEGKEGRKEEGRKKGERENSAYRERSLEMSSS